MPSRQKAIREKCVECCDGNTTVTRCCPSVNCSLWPFRMGYTSSRNKLYYDRDFYFEYRDMPQEQFNRLVKRAQLGA